MLTINLNDQSFNVRPNVPELISDMRSLNFHNMQEMLVEFFGLMEDGVYSDEYALAIEVYFKGSKATEPKARQGRCSTDVRKYNKALFKCQGKEVPEQQVRHLDGGTRSQSKRDELHATMALEAIVKQLG